MIYSSLMFDEEIVAVLNGRFFDVSQKKYRSFKGAVF